MRKMQPFFLASLASALLSCSTVDQQQLAKPAQQQQIPATEKIRAQGAQIIQQGARLQIILPTDTFFRTPGTQIRTDKVETIRLIAEYLKKYSQQFKYPPAIVVSGYTDTVYNRKTREELSQQYAEVIAAFLWDQGFSHKQLKVQGKGATDTIANPKTTTGSSYNRRVVIKVN